MSFFRCDFFYITIDCMRTRWKCILLVCLISGTLKAQNVLDHVMNGSEQGKSLPEVLSSIEETEEARFFFLQEWIGKITVQKNFAGKKLGEALSELFEGTDLNVVSMYPKVVVIIKDPTKDIKRREALISALMAGKKVESYQFGEEGDQPPGTQLTIQGEVIDWTTGEALPYATVTVNDTLTSAASDENGLFTLRLQPGTYVLNFSFLGYDEKVFDLLAYDNGKLFVELEKESTELAEVVVQGERVQDLTKSKIGRTYLSVRDIKLAPAFLGEVDLVKQVQTLPGVTTVGEAATGFNVRGGSVDQNLILYDGMPVFNSSHVFGFLTTFNPEAVNDVAFYKGGIPANYGGRISSVLDIKSKDGDMEKWNANVGLGMITSNAMVNGPIKEGKTSVAASVRSTYSNWLVHSIKTDYADLSDSKVGFYDATLKLTHLVSEDTKLSFTGYSSKDAFSLEGDTTYRWHNLQASARLDHQFTPQLGSDFTLGYTLYGYDVENEDPRQASELTYRIGVTALKSAFHLDKRDHKLDFGWQLSHYLFKPGMLEPTASTSNAATIKMDNQYSIENAFYINDEWELSDNLTLEGGLRIPMFFSFGKADVFTYEPGQIKQLSTITDTLNYKGGEVIKSYFGLEPRLSMNWKFAPETSLKVGYNRIYQFLHLVTNTAAVTPVDIWQPSGYYFRPQIADQVSAGLFKDFNEKAYGISTEVFYKHIDNLIDFKDGAQLILNNHLETELLQGTGEAYGVETSFFKNSGKFTGNLSYTYSRSFRTIAGPTNSESINQGERYPANYDQPHIINLSWKLEMSKRHYFTGNFTYHSGRPVTIPLAVFGYDNNSVAYFSGRNQYRIPDYHRLDLALVVEGNHNKRKKWKGTWVFSIYNVYARKNPYTIFFRTSNAGVPEPYQLSIVGTLLPSISYNLKLD